MMEPVHMFISHYIYIYRHKSKYSRRELQSNAPGDRIVRTNERYEDHVVYDRLN